MPTLADVAKHAGVSTATVSRVLSNTPYFSEETRQKVLTSIRALGYVPNSAARALASGRTNIVAFVFPYFKEGIADDPAITQILQGVEAESRLHGYHILMISPSMDKNGVDEHYRRLILSQNIDGVIAADTSVEHSTLDLPREHNIPCVAMGHREAEYYVNSDSFSSGVQLMEHILGLGHRRIGIISAYSSRHYMRDRVRGLCSVAQDAGIDFKTLPRIESDLSIKGGETAAEQLLTQHPDITAIIALTDRMAIGAIQKARELGYRVPDELSVTGHDNIPMAARFLPPLTTIDHYGVSMGRSAMRMMSEILDGKKPASISLPTDLLIRQTTQKVKP